jgi:hypothetical protein
MVEEHIGNSKFIMLETDFDKFWATISGYQASFLDQQAIGKNVLTVHPSNPAARLDVHAILHKFPDLLHIQHKSGVFLDYFYSSALNIFKVCRYIENSGYI